VSGEDKGYWDHDVVVARVHARLIERRNEKAKRIPGPKMIPVAMECPACGQIDLRETSRSRITGTLKWCRFMECDSCGHFEYH